MRKSSIIGIAALLASVGWAHSSASAEEMSRPANHFARTASINIGSIEADPKLCRKDFGLDLRKDAASLSRRIGSKMGSVERAAKNLSSADQAHPEVAPLWKKFKALEACVEMIDERLKSLNTLADVVKFSEEYDKTLKGVSTKLCSGKFGLEEEAAGLALSRSVQNAAYFKRRWVKSLKPEVRAHPDVAKRIAAMEVLIKCEPAVTKAVKANEAAVIAAKKALKDRYFAFMGAGSKYSRTITSLVSFVESPDDNVRATSDPALLAKYNSELTAVHALCTGEFKGIKNDTRYGFSDKSNPEKWCAAAAMREDILKSLALKAAKDKVKYYVELLEKQINEFELYNGYIRMSGSAVLYDLEGVKKGIIEKVAPALEVAGVTAPDSLFTELDATVATLWKKINDTGPKWKATAKDGNEGSAVSAAKKAFKGKDGKFKKAYTTRKEWRVVKNAIGVAIRRTKPGYIIYQVPGDKKQVGKLCRGRSFTYQEEAAGRRFKKAKEITELGYIRFERCK